MKKEVLPVSVIIPCFNCSDLITRAVKSVISQVSLPGELILIDDFSNDEGKTKKAIKQIKKNNNFLGQINIKLIFLKKNSGPAGARNKGWDNATKDYIAFLDADDSWHPQKLKVQYDWMKSNAFVGLTSHDSEIYFSNKKTVSFKRFFASRITFKDMLFSNQIQTRTVMLKAKLPFRFDSAMRYGDDYNLWIRMISEGKIFYRSNQSLAYIYRSEYSKGGLSSNLAKMERDELCTIYQQYHLGKINFFTFLAASLWSIIKFLRRVTKKLIPSPFNPR
jgi:glycosyltransferase involved in cell wall biosynthesis